MAETSGAYDGGMPGARAGLASGTQVATAIGWRPVEALTEGDMVLTFDAGLQPVSKVTRRPIWVGGGECPKRFRPMNVPAGALGNRGDVTLLSGQYIMIESDAGEDLFGDPFSLIQAGALDGVNGIEPVMPNAADEAVVLHFEQDQVVFARSGVLFYCPSSRSLLDQLGASPSAPTYKALPEDETEVLMMCIESDAAARTICKAEPLSAVA